MNVGIICPADIALRRFMPALSRHKNLTFAGVGMYSAQERFGKEAFELNDSEKAKLKKEREKAIKFTEKYGGKIFDSYEAIVTSKEIDAVYLPLPPALHYPWARLALENNKHIFLEKPATTSIEDTKKLVELAKSKKLVIFENYAFLLHNQVKKIDDIITDGTLGDIRLYRLSFGFPKRNLNDFRYDKTLGGGALLDAGGYTLKYAAYLLGDPVKIKYANLNYTKDIEVDIYGSATLQNKAGVTAQIAFGMDNEYKCELEIWGSRGFLQTERIFTAPSEFTPIVTLKCGNETSEIKLISDDSFYNALSLFKNATQNMNLREYFYKEILLQGTLIEKFGKMCNVEE